MPKPKNTRGAASRRSLLKKGAAAVAGGAALVTSADSLAAQGVPPAQVGRHVMFMGLTGGDVPFPDISLALLGRTIHPGQQGGLHLMLDIPRFVTLIERGLIDAKSMITRTYRIDETRQAIQDTADRTIMAGVVLYT